MILSLSGGGLNGLAYLGLFRNLEVQGIKPNQFKIYGSSIGAMFGALWAMGFEAEFLIKLFVQNTFLPQADLSHFIEKYGLDDGQQFENILKNVISQKFNQDITLRAFQNIFICTCNITHKKVEYLSHETYPDLPVYLAIRMSCNLPFIFTPILYKESLYIDAAAMENVPMPLFYDEPTLFCKFEQQDLVQKNDNTSSKSPLDTPVTAQEKQDPHNLYLNYISNIFSLVNQDRFSLMERFITRIYSKSYILRLSKPFHVCNFWVNIDDMNKQILSGYQTARKDTQLSQFLKSNLVT